MRFNQSTNRLSESDVWLDYLHALRHCGKEVVEKGAA
jgi:hypothetical protein